MKSALFVAMTLCALTLSGCTDADKGDINAPEYAGPKAELYHTDVPIDGSEKAGVDCDTGTHLYVEYVGREPVSGDNDSTSFSVIVYSESSLERTDEDGNPVYSGIQIFPGDGQPQSFDGNATGTYEVDLSGTSGTWVVEVHRSQYHIGQFIVRLNCVY
jgi:hypothetical protein